MTNTLCSDEYNENLVSTLPLIPHMEGDELRLLYNCASNAKTIVEFGTGGSSLLFSKMDKVVYSFDTDKNYLETIKNYDLVKNRIGKKHFFFHSDIGQTREWGIPTEPLKYNFFTSIGKDLLAINLNNVDLFFIDGRYRVETALAVFANSRNDAAFIIHDFTNREYYAEITNYFKVVKSVKTLVLLSKKDDVNLSELINKLTQYQQDYR